MLRVGSPTLIADIRRTVRMDQWHALRVRRRWLLGLSLGWLPFMGLLEVLQRHGLAVSWAVALTLLYFGGLIGVGRQLHRTSCPRCRRPFLALSRVRARTLWSWSCDSCDAPLGAPIR